MKEKVKILDFQQVANGIKLCLDNAKLLIEEAEILSNNKKYRGSVVLSLFALEELAKIGQIFNLLEPVDKINVQSKWKEFYNNKFCCHKKKLISSFTNKIIADIEKTGGEEIKKIIVKNKPAKKMPDLIALKEACLYVNCDLNKKEFIAPYEIKEDIAIGLIRDAKERLIEYKQFDKVTIKEVESALKEFAGDSYWEDRPFEADSKRIIDKLKEIESRAK